MTASDSIVIALEHCEYECVCIEFRMNPIFGSGVPCSRNHNGCRKCSHDTRLFKMPDEIINRVLKEIEDGLSAYEKEHGHQQVRSRLLSEEIVKITQREWERGYNDGCSASVADLNLIEHNATKKALGDAQVQIHTLLGDMCSTTHHSGRWLLREVDVKISELLRGERP